MKTDVLGLFLPAVVILHNYEEYRAFDTFKEWYMKFISEKLRQRKVFLFALAILTLAITLISFLNYFFNSSACAFLMTTAVLALLLNGVQHCATSVWARKILPGTVSGLFVCIPYALLYLVQLKKEIAFDAWDLVVWSLLSASVLFSSIYVSLQIGYVLYGKK